MVTEDEVRAVVGDEATVYFSKGLGLAGEGSKTLRLDRGFGMEEFALTKISRVEF